MTPDAPSEPINSPSYWDRRFASGDWEENGGRSQTRLFAEEQVRRIRLPADFRGTLLDFGCGLGDAFPVYRARWPHASLVGMDASAAAVERCRERYGDLATFLHGDHRALPDVDVVIASNVLEHLRDHEEVAAHLFARCKRLYVVVPYAEVVTPGKEHVNSYRRDSLPALGARTTEVFPCRGWSQYGWLLFRMHRRNVMRVLRGQPRRRRMLQILFRFDRAPL